MNIHKIIIKSVMMAALLLVLAGCEFPSFVPENLMRPPLVSGDGAQIQQAMTEQLGTQITLRYPRSGEHRSAVVRADVDSDDYQEAVVFYRMATESSGAHMALLDKSDEGRWDVIGETENSGGDIDRVLFGDITGDGRLDIITGWSVYAGSCVVTAHTCAGGVLSPIDITDIADDTGMRSAALYNEMAVGDFDGNGRDDILTAYINTADGSVTAQILAFRGGAGGTTEMGVTGQAMLSGDVVEYIGSCAGQVSQNTPGFVIDGRRRDGKYITEVIYWDKSENRLIAPVSAAGEGMDYPMSRTLATLSRDINGDGIIEFPTDRLLTGYTAESEHPLYVTTWNRLGSDGDIREVFDSLIFEDSGYYLILREAWRDRISAQPDKLSNVTYFCAPSGDNPFAEEVMRIKLFTLDEWEDERDHDTGLLLGGEDEAPHYMELAVTDYYVYAVLISDGDALLDTSYESVLDSFRLME